MLYAVLQEMQAHAAIVCCHRTASVITINISSPSVRSHAEWHSGRRSQEGVGSQAPGNAFPRNKPQLSLAVGRTKPAAGRRRAMSSREDQLRAWRSSRSKALQPSSKGNTNAQAQQAPSGVQLRKTRRRSSAARRGADKENTVAGHLKSGKPSVASWRHSTESKLNVLTDALHVLKRDSVRPAISGQRAGHATGMQADTDHSQQLLQTAPPEAAGPEDLFQLADGQSVQGLAQEAAQLFGDADFVAAFEHVQNFQLLRTSNGATDKSRIVELAGGGQCACCCTTDASGPTEAR